jgi:hypothetical protein
VYSDPEVLARAAEEYAEAIRMASAPADHLAAAQAIGDNTAIHPTDQGLVLAAGLSIYVKRLGEAP